MAERDDENRKTMPHAQGRSPEVSADRPPAPDAFVSEEVDTRDREHHRAPRKTRS